MVKTKPDLEIFGLKNVPLIKPGDNLADIILSSMDKQELKLENRDIIIISQTIISKAEGSIVKLNEVRPSLKAKIIAEKIRKLPEIVEVILHESKNIIRMRNGHLITQNKINLVCANSGVDISNVSGGDAVTILPRNPDNSAKQIREEIKKRTGKNVAVIISDTSGRPLRVGQINIAIGVAGMNPIFDRKGEKDLFGYRLQVKEIAIADEIASAAELVMGEASEGIPVAIVRGYKYRPNEKGKASSLSRLIKLDLFI